MNTIIALPCCRPGGLDSGLEAHFGHCEFYTLVTLEDGKIGQVDVIPNIPHEQGGCMGPVSYLARNRVKTLIAGGMGMRPLMGFQQMGIEVYHNNGARTVAEAVQAFTEGRLPQFSREFTCGGGGGMGQAM